MTRRSGVSAGHGAQLAVDQLTGSLLFGGGVDLGEGFLRHLVGHALPPQLDGDGAAREPPSGMARADPLPGERGVVDQPDLVEPLQHRIRRLVGDSPLAQRLRELLAGAGALGEQAQADLPRDRHGVGLGLIGRLCRSATLPRRLPAPAAVDPSAAPAAGLAPGSRARCDVGASGDGRRRPACA